MPKSFILKKLENEGFLKFPGKALDLGSGKGSDAEYLLSLGFNVDIVDKNKDAIDGFLSESANLRKFNQDLTEFNIEKSSYDIIIASNSLPFIESKELVIKTIKNIVNGLTKNGIAYISLFGPNDDWAKKETMSFFDYEEVQNILDEVGVYTYFKSTEEGNAPTMKGEIKWWHIHRFYFKLNK